MLRITRQGVEKLIDRLDAPDGRGQCRAEVERMLKIESELLWWAEKGKICRWQAKTHFDGRIHLLKEILKSLDEGNIARTSSLLKEYASQQDTNGTGVIRF